MNIEYKKLSGVYLIKCLANGKFYIGSAKCLYTRLHVHFSMLNRNEHPNIHLQRSYNKNGSGSFLFGIIEFTTSQELLIREQYYIDSMEPSFNIAPHAANTLGVKINLSPEMKKHLSECRKKQCSENNPMQGKTHSPVTRKLISDKIKAANVRRGGLHPNFQNASMRSKLGIKQSVESINKRVEKQRKLSNQQVMEIKKYLSEGMYQKDIAKKFNISQRLVCRVNTGVGVYGTI